MTLSVLDTLETLLLCPLSPALCSPSLLAILDELLRQYLRRTAEQGGLFWESERGIPLGSPLSPILGAFFLSELDQRLERTGLFYVRFMDDILVLAPTRWKLRRAVRVLNQVFLSSTLELEKQSRQDLCRSDRKGL